jgi:hypothetical protein
MRGVKETTVAVSNQISSSCAGEAMAQSVSTQGAESGNRTHTQQANAEALGAEHHKTVKGI